MCTNIPSVFKAHLGAFGGGWDVDGTPVTLIFLATNPAISL